MVNANSIRARGVVLEVMKHGAYRVELGNGHRCIAKASGDVRLNFVTLNPGDPVQLDFQPYDLSRARIILAES